jgi:hypothetical protein
VALSPDGRRLAFVATDTTGHGQVWIRALDALTTQPLANTADAETPFWSPDSQWLAFVQNGKLKKIEISGGQVVPLADALPYGGAWNRDDVIVFSQPGRSLAQIRARGGTPSPLAAMKGKDGNPASLFPVFLPDGRHFVVYVTATLISEPGPGRVYVGSLDGTSPTPLQWIRRAESYTRVGSCGFCEAALWWLSRSM